SEEHTSELQSRQYLVCRLLLEKKDIRIARKSARAPSIAASNALKPRACRSRATSSISLAFLAVFFFNDTAPTEIYTLSPHDALPISSSCSKRIRGPRPKPSRRRASSPC